MDCSCDDVVKSVQLLRKEHRYLINEIKMYKYRLEEERTNPCSSCKYGKIRMELTVHK